MKYLLHMDARHLKVGDLLFMRDVREYEPVTEVANGVKGKLDVWVQGPDGEHPVEFDPSDRVTVKR